MVTRGPILLVEDIERARVSLRDALVHEGYRVLSAATTEEALAVMHRVHVGLVLIDAEVPHAADVEEAVRDGLVDPYHMVLMTGALPRPALAARWTVPKPVRPDFVCEVARELCGSPPRATEAPSPVSVTEPAYA